MVKDFISEDLILAYALKNAIAYGGKANAGAVVSSLFNHGLERKNVKEIMPKVNAIVKDISGLSLAQQEIRFKDLKSLVSEREQREGLAELPDVKKSGVVMRFSPAPSGPMHIGNALVALFNYAYFKKYGGKIYVRIEDTDPESIDGDAYDLIKDDSKWLFKGEAEILIQSERVNLYYEYAEKFIKLGKAYVCTCSSEDFKKFVGEMKNCPCRKLSEKENLERWEKMFSSDGFKQGEAVLRFKSSMKDKNPAMRDFPLARINETKHPIQKNKYRVWPLMNLAVAVDDIELGMTHIIRGKDHRDNAERQKLMFEALGKKYPWCAFLGRYKFKDFELSKTKIREAISRGEYSGWDDERLPTIASIRKRYKQESLVKFIEQIGLSEVDKVIEKKSFFDMLDRFENSGV